MDEPARVGDATHVTGLRALGLAASALALSAAVPYVLPGLERYRPWVPGEPVPMARLYVADEETVVASAEGSGQGAEGSVDSIARALSEPVIPPPITTTGANEAEVRIDPSELDGLVREIEDASGTAMDAFYAQLRRTALAPRDATGADAVVTRIAHFGDSTIALDGITMTTRESLQLRFGDAGHGFVLAARGLLPYRHFQVRHDTEGNWRMFDLTHAGLSDGRYGLGGVQVRSASGATAWFASDDDEESRVGRSVSTFLVFHQRHPRGGELAFRVDEGEWQTLDTESTTVEDGVERIEVPDGEHRLSLRTAGHGETRLYGVALERQGPGVVYDSLGIVGARASRMLGFEAEHLRTQLAQRETNLVVIAFGGNDADDNRDEEDFFGTFRQVAHLVRTARPEASCLLFAPLDQAERDERGRVVTLAPVPRIVSASRRAAEAEGCAFFDTWSAMGGEGAMGRWFRRSPRLSSADFRHATPAGYRVIGNMFYRALLAGFRDYLARPGHEAPRTSSAATQPSGG
jgi:lysophospholipase L1-like esterase